jgi:hypothetical protein
MADKSATSYFVRGQMKLGSVGIGATSIFQAVAD